MVGHLARFQWRRPAAFAALLILALPILILSAQPGDASPKTFAMGITLLDDDCERTRTGCGPGGGGGGGGDPIPVGGCNPVLTQQTVARDFNPELNAAFSRVAFGAKWFCSSGVNIVSLKVTTELWDRTSGQRISVLDRATEVTAVNTESARTTSLYDVQLWPGARRAEVVLLVEVDAGPGRIWQCQDAGVVPWYWCEGEGTRRLSAVMGFGSFDTMLQDPKPNFAVLGDSFSSGSGTQGYYGSNGNGEDFQCLRSRQSYGARLVRKYPGVLNWGLGSRWLGKHWEGARIEIEGFKACHGAVVNDVYGQLSAVSTDTKVVAMTIGGNDLDFGPHLRTCLANDDNLTDCGVARPSPDTGRASPLITAQQLQNLKTELVKLYKAIKPKMATGGKLLILNYPKIFPGPGGLVWSRCPYVEPRVTNRELTQIQEAWNATNAMITNAVAEAGDSSIILVDVGEAFNGKDLCAKTQWANGVHLHNLIEKESFHPNALGHEAIFTIVEQKMKQLGILP